jgi:lipopolysaccharide transport system permease protein
MLFGMVNGRYLAYRLFRKEVKASYAQAQFGILWDFLEPLVLALIFVILRQGRAINTGEIEIPYAVFVLFGFLLWRTFADGLTLPLTVMQRNKSLVTRVKVPAESLMLAMFMKILFDSFFRVIILLLVSIWLGVFSPEGFAKFVLLYPSIILVGAAFGFLLAPFNVVYSDVGRVVKISMRPLFYASPVIFYAPKVAFLAIFYSVSPISIVLSNLRSLATQNSFMDLPAFVITCGILVVLFMIGWFIFHLSVPVLSNRL